jgi:hypothetical protein
MNPLPKTVKMWSLFGTFIVLAGFIIGGLLNHRNERQQLDALLGPAQPLPDFDKKDPDMVSPFEKGFDPFNRDSVDSLWRDLDKTFYEQRRLMDEQMRASMQTMDQFQKRMQASKPYTLTSDAKQVIITIPLKDKNDALNYTIDVQPNGFVVQYRHTVGTKAANGQQGQAATQTSMQSFMESVAEPLQADKASQVVKGNQLIVTVPKAALQPVARQPVQVYGETGSGSSPLPEDAI